MRLKDAIETDRSNLTRIEPPQQAEKLPPANSDARLGSLLKNPNQRCPLPPTSNSADSLRQWGQGSEVPKFRTNAPPNNVGGSGGSSTSTTVVSVSSSSSGGGSTPTPLPTALNASVTTTVLAPGQTWTGTLQMSRGFLVQQVTVNAFARVELYGSKIAQTLDISRPVTVGPSNTTRGLIMDVALLTAKTWSVLDCVGSNNDATPSSTIYITVTNLSTGAGAITASLQYVPQES